VGLKGTGRYTDALAVFEEILSVQQKGTQSANDVLIEKWKVFFHMANCYEALGDAARAGALFIRVLERNRDLSEPLEGFFRTVGKRSDLQIVLAEFDRLEVLFPQHPDLHANHAMLLRAAGRPDRAYQNLRKAQELPNAKPEYHELELSWAADDEQWDSLPDIVHRAEGFHRESFPFYRLALDLAVRRKEYAFASRILDAMLTRVFDQVPHEARTKYIALNEKIMALSGGRG
jgi:tetratricopeptide (TPR) repeat protein